MALSTNTIDYVAETTQNGVTTTVATQPADNCHTIVILNVDGASAAYVAIVDTADVLSATYPPLAAGGALTLRIGTAQYRPGGSLTGGTQRLRVEGIGGTPVLSFQFINTANNNVAP